MAGRSKGAKFFFSSSVQKRAKWTLNGMKWRTEDTKAKVGWKTVEVEGEWPLKGIFSWTTLNPCFISVPDWRRQWPRSCRDAALIAQVVVFHDCNVETRVCQESVPLPPRTAASPREPIGTQKCLDRWRGCSSLQATQALSFAAFVSPETTSTRVSQAVPATTLPGGAMRR